MKMRKNIIITVGITLAYTLPVLAQNATDNDILTNNDISHCSSQLNDDASDCSENLVNQSDSKLLKTYDNKLNALKKMDASTWWMGNQDQKNNMISNFMNSQALWEQYKIAYCKSASSAEENTHGYSDVLSSCFINMNERRIQDINLMPNEDK